ncbi:MAG: hypothetical protein NVSMB51_14550 [Solirubrobacteraceae bacterium]
MAQAPQNPMLRAGLIGFAAGLRTFTPAAAIVLRRAPAHPAWRAFPALAAGEYVWDKLPIATSRLEPPALIARLASGAAGGWLVAGRASGALAGTAAAALAAPLGYHARRWLRPRLGVPDAGWALAEDCAAVGAAALALRAA